MNKRTKFVITTILLSTGFLLVNSFSFIPRIYAISLLSLSTVLLFRWALSDSITTRATLLVLILPSLFTLGVGLFWFLLPTTFLAKFPVLILYSVGIYILFLTMNIFAVSTARTIALSRAAKGVSFVLTLFTAFLLFEAILSSRIPLVLSLAAIFVSSFLLFMQGLWVSQLTKKIDKEIPIYSATFSYGVAAIALSLYFWPVTLISGSIFLTAPIYTLLGLGQAKQEGRLFKQTVREYLSIAIFIFLMLFISTNWR